MNRSTAIIGSFLVLLGLFFFLRSLDLIWFDFGDLLSVLFPLALIAAGIWLIGRKKKGVQFNAGFKFSETPATSKPERPETADYEPSNIAQKQAASNAMPSPPPRQPAEETANASPSTRTGKIRFNKMLGDMFIDCEGFNLTSVEVSAGVGDLEIKISGGVLSPGLNRMIISGFIGDIRIFVPREMAFFAHCSNFVGDIEISGKRASGFGNTIEHQSANYDQSESKLYIAANSFIGDMKIYQV